MMNVHKAHKIHSTIKPQEIIMFNQPTSSLALVVVSAVTGALVVLAVEPVARLICQTIGDAAENLQTEETKKE